MQHDSCEEIQLLISRLVDDEVSPSERERVEQHVAICDECAYKMLEFMEMAVLFSETPLRRPAPELRASVFREIDGVKEEAQLKEEAEKQVNRKPWPMPAPPARPGKRPLSSTFFGRLLQAASPFAMAATALFVFLGALLVGNKLSPDTPPTNSSPVREVHPPYALPTRDMPSEVNSYPNSIPVPVTTKVELASASPAAPSTSYVEATATLGRDAIIDLAQPTPVMEDGDVSDKSSWHTMRDPEYGYTISYPPNWWTRVVANDGSDVGGDVRYFYPWTAGGTRFAPYWVEMRVSNNTGHYTAANSNQAICGGKCEPVPSAQNPVWLRRSLVDVEAGNSYDEAYTFDSMHIYQFRVTVPTSDIPGAQSWQDRLAEAQGIFSVMSGRLALAGSQAEGESTFGGVLFLSGTDLWLASQAQGRSPLKVTRGYVVKQFAQSPDLSTIAFTAADPSAASGPSDNQDPWARSVYLTHISSDRSVFTLLLSNMEVHDIAWYSDHELLVLAQNNTDGLVIYRIALETTKSKTSDGSAPQIEKLVSLPDTLVGAKSLAVSPDRQLITFLAPVGEKQNTDIYAVRPDGTNLMKIVSHSDPAAPVLSGAPVLAPDSQAVKSYVWADGHLEKDGYAANILFTCGNSYGPFSYPGGFLYSTATANNLLLDPASVLADEPESMQISQIAYSGHGSVAVAGYRTDVNGRADQLMGLWTANIVDGALQQITSQPLPVRPDGVTDLQWSPDGTSLIYRETIPISDGTVSSRYDGGADFRMMKLDPDTGKTVLLFDGELH